MSLVVSVLSICIGIVVVVFRKGLARRGGRMIERKYGAFGAEAAKSITPAMVLFTGFLFIALGVFQLVSFAVAP